MASWEEDAEFRNPTFSLAERDRRWALVRSKMAEQGIAAIICLTSGAQYRMAHVRYLTQLDDGEEDTAVVFPLEGEPTAWSGRAGAWPSGNWFSDIRGREGRFWGRNVGGRLKELGLDGATIGVASLRGSILADGRNPEGQAGHGSLQAVQEQVPRARLVDATALLGECRYIKSAEEIAFLEQGMKIAQAVLDSLLQHARPGVPERLVYAAMLEVYVRLGGTMPIVWGWVSGPAGRQYIRLEQPAMMRKVHAGDIYLPELIGRYAGYWAEMEPMVAVGDVPHEFHDAHKLAVDSFNRLMDAMKPGSTVADLARAAHMTALGGRLEANLNMHGRGLGDDGPLVTGLPERQLSPEIASLAMAPGVCMVLTPTVSLDGRREPVAARFGDSVVVTETGARRLGNRTQDFLQVG